jgi:hypothetical protein
MNRMINLGNYAKTTVGEREYILWYGTSTATAWTNPLLAWVSRFPRGKHIVWI